LVPDKNSLLVIAGRIGFICIAQFVLANYDHIAILKWAFRNRLSIYIGSVSAI